jgi:hypothetical protein
VPNPTAILSEFVLEQLPEVPIRRRVLITRALAEVTANAKERADLLSVANLLEDVERNHRQLVLNFKRRNEGS